MHQISDEMKEVGENVEMYIQGKSWSKKILKIHTRFLSPFSVDVSKIYLENSWYAVQIVVPE